MPESPARASTLPSTAPCAADRSRVSRFWIPAGARWALGLAVLATSGTALAQGAARDQSGTISTAPADQNKSWLERKFGGSSAELSTYIGSGTFYATGYSNPYVSNALFLRPVYQLGTKYNLTLNARVYLEEEYTQPDNSTGRRFYPLDTWLWLAAKNLYTAPVAKVRFSGVLRTVIPTSYESRYAHLRAGIGVGGSASRVWEVGRPNSQGKRWELSLALGSTFTKYLRSEIFRGDGPGDTSGCRAPTTLPAAGAGAGAAGQLPTSSDSDRCGTVLNTSFATMTSGSMGVSRGAWSFTTTLIVINEFRYSFAEDAFTDPNAVPMGRADWTWGIVAAGYQLTERVGLSVGVASYQPALDSRYKRLRFPFFDLSGANANNFTQAFVSLNATL